MAPMSNTTESPVRDEDLVFAQWQSLPDGPEKQLQEEILVRLLIKHAYAVCWLTLGERRGDIANEAVFRALTKRDSFKGDSKFSTWFQAIVMNLCKMDLRDNSGPEMVGLEEADKLEVTPLVVEKIQLEQIEAGLDEKNQELLRMKYEGLSETEIAKRLDINLVTVRQRWMRLRKQVKDGEQ